MILGEEDLGDAVRVPFGNGSDKAVIPGIESCASVHHASDHGDIRVIEGLTKEKRDVGDKADGLLGSLTTHGDRGIRRSQVSLVLRVSTYYYQHPPTIHGVAVKWKNKMGDGRRDPKGHQANSAR